MSNIFDWIGENAYWIFDGIGIIAITGILGVIFKKRKNKEKILVLYNFLFYLYNTDKY